MDTSFAWNLEDILTVGIVVEKYRFITGRGKHMKIYDFTKPEIEYFLQNCNFTEEEEVLFRYRSKNIPLEVCAEIMNVSISTVNRISKRVNKKIVKVC